MAAAAEEVAVREEITPARIGRVRCLHLQRSDGLWTASLPTWRRRSRPGGSPARSCSGSPSWRNPGFLGGFFSLVASRSGCWPMNSSCPRSSWNAASECSPRLVFFFFLLCLFLRSNAAAQVLMLNSETVGFDVM